MIQLPKQVTLDPTSTDPETVEKSLDESMGFYYFAYGSNLMAKCIHHHCPTALRVDVGQLHNYRLDFVGYSNQWVGSLATSVPSKNHTLWGAIWKLDRPALVSLDSEKNVNKGMYKVMERCIERSNGSMLLCRMYQHCTKPPEGNKIQLTRDRMPSATYLDIIREGAKESELPEDYVKFLYSIPDNGKTTSLENCYNVAQVG